MWFGQVENQQVSGTLEALSSGGIFGAGFAHGGFRNDGVPYLESDYLFALVGEELGLVGMWLVLALWLSFLWFALRVAFGGFSRPGDFETFELEEVEILVQARRLPVSFDGEVVRMRSPIRYRSRPRALTVIVPLRQEARP